MSRFASNNFAIKRNSYVNKETIKIFIVAPFFTVFILVLLYISMSKAILFFYIAAIYFIILTLLFAFYAPLRMLRRHNHTIESIAFYEGFLVVNSFKALWLKPKEYKIPDKGFRVKMSKFPWYGKGVPDVKEGITMQVTGKKDIYFVYDYFDEYEKIKDELLSRSK
jgi:hypothetical protein